jgi:nicotinate dehydrogenase subunit B
MSAPLLPISRRSLIKGAGSLVVSFSLPVRVGFAQQAGETPTSAATPKLPGSLAVDPYLDSWIRLEPNDAVTLFTGKAELGQGIKTALLQVAAEELGLPVERLTIVTADTSRAPNEGYTAGSHSMQDSGAAIRNAAAQMRELLIEQAARRLNLTTDELKAENGAVIAPDGAVSRMGCSSVKPSSMCGRSPCRSCATLRRSRF